MPRALAHPADQVLHRRLAVRRAEQGRAGGGQRVQRLDAHLGRAGAEASVGGLQRLGDGDLVGHGDCYLGSSRAGDLTSLSACAPLFWHPRPRQPTNGTHDQHHAGPSRPSGSASPRSRPGHPAAGRGGAGGVRRAVRRPGRSPIEAGVFDPPRGAFFLAGSTTCRSPWAAGGCGPTYAPTAARCRPRSSGCTSHRPHASRPGAGDARAPGAHRAPRPVRTRWCSRPGRSSPRRSGSTSAGYERVEKFGHYAWSPKSRCFGKRLVSAG